MRRIVVIVVFLLGISWFRGELQRQFESWTDPAEWIWWSTDIRTPEPVAFVATRSFRIPKAGSAELRIAGDREYVVYVNGRRIGGGRGGEDLILRRLDVSELLVPGWNRLAVELRSDDGIGGLLATLSLAGVSDRYLVSDPSWRIEWDWEEAIHPGSRPRSAAAAASWGRPPIHPWRYPTPGVLERGLHTVPGAPTELVETASRNERRYFRLPAGQEKVGILVLKFRDRGRRVVDYALLRAGASPGQEGPSSAAVVPAGKGYWDSPGQVVISGVSIWGDESDAVTGVEVLPSNEPLISF